MGMEIILAGLSLFFQVVQTVLQAVKMRKDI
jgi:hypothetical protein